MNSALTSINIVAIINIIILCSFLCFRKKNILPNYILAFVFLLPGLYFIDNIFIFRKDLEVLKYSFFIVQIAASLFPVLIYYYIHLLLTDGRKFHPLLISGSLLIFAYIVCLAFNFTTLSVAEKGNYLTNLGSDADYPIEMLIYNVVFYFWQMVYLLVLVVEIKRYTLNAANTFSSFDKIKIVFIKKFIFLLSALNFLLVIFYIILPLPIVDYGILPVAVTVVYLFLIYQSIKHKVIFSKESYHNLISENASLNLAPMHKTGVIGHLTVSEDYNAREELIASKLKNALYTQKVFLNPEFKLHNLSEMIGEQSYLVSQVLNKQFEKTFFELINELRVKEAQERLKDFDPKKDTIENIAYEVGFNSRASFYRSFKKHTGKTPTELL